MVETTKTYKRETDHPNHFATQIQVSFDSGESALTYVGHWDENGDISEFNLTPADLLALLDMLNEAARSTH
ncbi:hypothetical protein [Streptomyces sp. 769]|uniref:hypothetical protein n=1 Tax=Streptomyces sp. 769 TaxID=1262452 RepID=UPI00057DDDC4|nr:hypothetical protein [Streptomyces sp. 769]AJC53968.1 hypothetical protein GZL_01368 [Streptomyces sp. 769]